ncbi:hypothetical protein F5X99DRAFT_365534 [Biscogniauxia marginata]|nr:hypothetical protein F5X99DRAFT_365534 [Biscogniauxia marginata]
MKPDFKHYFDPFGRSWAIAYEFVPRAQPDIRGAQKFFDFFYAVGLLVDFRSEDWAAGRLVNMNAIKLPSASTFPVYGVDHHQADELSWTSNSFPRSKRFTAKNPEERRGNQM